MHLIVLLLACYRSFLLGCRIGSESKPIDPITMSAGSPILAGIFSIGSNQSMDILEQWSSQLTDTLDRPVVAEFRLFVFSHLYVSSTRRISRPQRWILQYISWQRNDKEYIDRMAYCRLMRGHVVCISCMERSRLVPMEWRMDASWAEAKVKVEDSMLENRLLTQTGMNIETVENNR